MAAACDLIHSAVQLGVRALSYGRLVGVLRLAINLRALGSSEATEAEEYQAG